MGRGATDLARKEWSATMCCLALAAFVYPISTCVVLGTDDKATTFVGRFPLIALLVIPFLLGIFAWQSRRAPDHPAVSAAGYTPCAFFIVVGMIYSFMCGRVADNIGGANCMRAPGVDLLVKEEKAALQFLDECRKGTDDPLQHILIQSCPGYHKALTDPSMPDREWAWTFLRKMEQSMFCAGMCDARPQLGGLWSFSNVALEPCSVPVSMHLRSYAKQASNHVMCYSFAVLIAFGFFNTYFWESIKERERALAPPAPEIPQFPQSYQRMV